jgi:lipid II isoglutaminyl synthase (glutamine-hydrolysing)
MTTSGLGLAPHAARGVFSTARSLVALGAGKLTREALRLSGRGATTLPGLIALRVDPALAGSLASRLPHGVVMITGTNGKTTTSRMLSEIARAAGWAPVHNRAGSNLARGIVSALVADATWLGEPRADGAIFEVDEASVVPVTRLIQPRVMLVTNLFRDQLDRYGELDTVARRMREAARALTREATLVLNADDPIVGLLADGFPGKVVRYGIDDPSVTGALAQNVTDLTHCPRCRARLEYTRVVLGHVGDYRCAKCGFARPEPEIAAVRVERDGDGTRLVLRGALESVTDVIRVPLPGIYNAYNALAAIAVADVLGLSSATAARALHDFRPAFGRLESVLAEGRTLRLVLVKNPAGFNAAVSTLLETGRSPQVLAALNDLDADGRDVSWIWDADFEALAPKIEWAVVTGLRAPDLALRLKYAGLAADKMTVVDGWRPAIRAALDHALPGTEIVVLATYTATLALRAALVDLGFAKPFWED